MAVGVTVTAVPEVADAVISLPPEVVPIFPVPLENTGVKVVELPLLIVEDPAVKEVAAGAATTVMVTDFVTEPTVNV